MKKIEDKPFRQVIVEGHKRDLYYGEPHSTSTNNFYAKLAGDELVPFDGHIRCIKIEIEENNYLKESQLSGDEVRKGCSVKVFENGTQIFEDWHRTFSKAYKEAERFIEAIEDLDWFPHKVESKIGQKVGYREQIFKIHSFSVEQGTMLIETLDGKTRKPFLFEQDGSEWDESDDIDNMVKIEITDPGIWWWVKQD